MKDETKEKIIDAISKVEIMVCIVCGKFINKEEYEQGDGACSECWSK